MARRKIEDREALVELHVRLHAEGKLSLRQIADMTGVSHQTVIRDLRRWHDDLVQSLVHNPPEWTSLDGQWTSAEEVR